MKFQGINNLSFKRFLTHILFWVTYITVSITIYGSIFNSKPSSIFLQTLRMLPFEMVSVYLILYIAIPVFLYKKKTFLFLFSAIITSITLIFIYKIFDSILLAYRNPELFKKVPFFDLGFLLANLESLLLVFTAGSIKIIKHWYNSQRKKLILEKQTLASELEVLRYQINPHFLFNVLNNLYSISSRNNDTETSNGIAKLSHMMRYMIHDSKAEKVNLEKEIEHIQNYLSLQELRFTGEYNIKKDFIINGNPDGKKICPLILITFVENAFKYGIGLNKESIIKILLDIKDQSIKFQVKNTINQSSVGIDSGIGLENVKRRLKLLYPETHSLSINNDHYFFEIILEIRL